MRIFPSEQKCKCNKGLQEYGGLPGFSVIAIFGIGGSFQTGIIIYKRHFGTSAIWTFWIFSSEQQKQTTKPKEQ
jgi:hypothetical protein